MHSQAFDWGFGLLRGLPDVDRVCELGSQIVNGTLRGVIPTEEWLGVDIAPGPGVDVVADAGAWKGPPGRFDCVVCTEVLEHAPNWPAILGTAWTVLRPGGYLVLSCASPAREPHSAVDGGKVRPGEYYAGVGRTALADELGKGFSQAVVLEDRHAGDLYALAVK